MIEIDSLWMKRSGTACDQNDIALEIHLLARSFHHMDRMRILQGCNSLDHFYLILEQVVVDDVPFLLNDNLLAIHEILDRNALFQ